MRHLTTLLVILVCANLASTPVKSQDVFADGFFTKQGITVQPEFKTRPDHTVFAGYNAKGKKVQYSGKPVMVNAHNRIRSYSSPAMDAIDSNRYFTVMSLLEQKDSAAYFEAITEFPQHYRAFFQGLYLFEANKFKPATTVFGALKTADPADSILTTESTFWNDVSQQLLADQIEYNKVCELYDELETPVVDKYGKIINDLAQVTSPDYQFHKYLIWFNYGLNVKDYAGAASVYDSVVLYCNQSKMRSALSRDRVAVQEMLQGKQTFINTTDRHLYYYQLADLYEHMVNWAGSYKTGKAQLVDANFTLNQKYTKPLDTVFTRYLVDTSATDSLSKFEVLSLTRAAWEKTGRRFVILKLAFNNHDTYRYYAASLKRFKSMPISRSILARNNTFRGNEYLVTTNFIASLYEQDEPVLKYVFSLYALEDKEGNFFAFDTLF